MEYSEHFGSEKGSIKGDVVKMESEPKTDIVLEDFNEICRFSKANEVIAQAKRTKYVFLGQRFYSLCMGNILTGEVEWFKYGKIIDDPKILSYLMSFEKILEWELNLPFFPTEEREMSTPDYIKELSGLLGRIVVFDHKGKYYGKGESGRALTDGQLKYIRDYINPEFRQNG